MKSNKLIEKIFNRRTKDYSFTIGFFLIFSFFILFVIRPNITTVFSLQHQLDDLQKLDKDYESAIFNIVTIQTALERNRDIFPLLNSAIPSTPQVNQVVDDIRKVASDSSIILSKMDITQINLKESKNKNNIKSYVVNLELTSDFLKTNKFINSLLLQRRLKTLKSLSITRNLKESSNSSTLRIKIQIDGYYL